MLIFVVAVPDGGVLGEDRDALLALEVHRVHDALGDVLVLAERAGLPEHRVDERRLAVVDVRDDRDVADVVARGHRRRVAATTRSLRRARRHLPTGHGLPPSPQFFGSCPSTITQVWSRSPSWVAAQSASVRPAMSFSLVSSLMRKSNSSTRMRGTVGLLSLGASTLCSPHASRRASRRNREPEATAASSGGSSSRPSATRRSRSTRFGSRPGRRSTSRTRARHPRLRPRGLRLARRDRALRRAAGFVPSGEARLAPRGSRRPRVRARRARRGTDLHAPMGATEPVVALDHVEPGQATGARSFQVLHGPHNGSTRATMFVGYIPPGKAPWHYHLYDEIVWILRGEGRLHIGDDDRAARARRRLPASPARGAHRREHAAGRRARGARDLHAGRQPLGRVPRAARRGTYAFSGDPSTSR